MSGNSQPHVHFNDLARQTISRFKIALFVTLAFILVEAYAGIAANSLTLLTDAVHNVTDVIALGLSWYALRLASQPSNAHRTFGNHRAGILVAMVNAGGLLAISLGVLYEAYRRFISPPEVQSGILVGVGALAFFVNLGTALLIRHGSETDLNQRSAFIHLAGDVLSTVGVVVAGIAILFTGWDWLDPLASAFIGLLILWNAWGILRETVDILLESTPRDVDMDKMVSDIMHVEGILGVHDLHVWSINSSLRTMSAHLVTADVPVSRGAAIQTRVNELVAHRYNIAHATLQLECVDCDPDALYCEMNPIEQVDKSLKKQTGSSTGVQEKSSDTIHSR